MEYKDCNIKVNQEVTHTFNPIFCYLVYYYQQ